MAGRIVHFEVPYDDAERARDFYSSLFGWQLQWLPEMDYTMVSTGPMSEQGVPTEPGFINGGMARREGPVEHPVVVIDVDDIDATLEAVGERGGSTLMGRQPVGDMGFTAYFRDCEGNVMGLWQSAAPLGGDSQAAAQAAAQAQGAGSEPDYTV
jgi:predicted enzyme related to lactoylglutathione lyase